MAKAPVKPVFDKDAYFRQLGAQFGQPKSPVFDRDAILRKVLKSTKRVV